MKTLLFPALVPGVPAGEPLLVRLTKKEKEALRKQAERHDVRSMPGGNHSIGAMVRAIAAGSLLVTRADAPAAAPVAGDVVHRGCPTD